MFRPLQKKVVTTRGSDILAITNAKVNMSLDEINSLTVEENTDFPDYTPDGNGAVLVFHTDSDSYVLGGVRINPQLKDTKYPAQLNIANGGGAPDKSRALKDSIMDSIVIKMYMKDRIAENEAGHKDQLVIEELLNVIGNDQGWSNQVCVHTDKWTNKDESVSTFCYITAIKHIQTTDDNLRIIEDALKTLSELAKAKGLPPRAISDYHFAALQLVIQSATDTYMDKEEEKARKALERYGEQIAVTFNDLAMATLAKADAFKCNEAAKLELTTGLKNSR